MTLDEFINEPYYLGKRDFVTAPGFKSLYVRCANRLLAGVMRPTLDLASMEVEEPKTGTLTRLLSVLRSNYPQLNLYIENVLVPELAASLERRGWTKDPRYPHDFCYFLLGAKDETQTMQ